ncbi:Mog1p/PsbP-like protein [Hesseltinella vesiculosa]|uniref:Mog1p/PsbP-like protein n=1 Tax=Hesseltinella vesiculosa TaxID=101127 RepID=A0A1X2G6L9_9FUNG|nr:Mog1p/PsbP-like protein [Hesseltinella vesiculosa]
MNRQPLFGGAMSTTVKASYLDASQIRQIPDNQEVFIDMNTQQSLIIELLEKVEHLNEEAARFHFEQIAEHNHASSYSIKSVEHESVDVAAPHLPLDTTVYFVRGMQNVAKFNEEAVNHVELVVAIVRLNKVDTDVIISLNVPTQVAAESSEMKDINQIEASSVQAIVQEIKLVVASLQVNDWGLFAA